MNLKSIFTRREKMPPAPAGNVHVYQAGNFTSTYVPEPPCDSKHVTPLELGSGRLFGLPGKVHDDWQTKLDTNIWLAQFRAPELMYYRNLPVELPYDESGPGDIIFPISDQKVPSQARMEQLFDIIKLLLSMGQEIGVSCQGGHGRTGTVLACVYGRFNPQDPDPAETIRETICDRMIESMAQEEFIFKFLGIPETERLIKERAESEKLRLEREARYAQYDSKWSSNWKPGYGWNGPGSYVGTPSGTDAKGGDKASFSKAYDWAY